MDEKLCKIFYYFLEGNFHTIFIDVNIDFHTLRYILQ